VLAAEGLVTMKVRRGAYVTEISRDDVAQVYHLLALLESDAAAHRGQQATEAQRAELARCTSGLKSRCASATPFSPPTNSSTWPAAMAGNRWALQTGAGPAQGDEAQPPPFAVQARAAGGVAGRAPRG
jgi:hypothetical protein